MDAESQPAPQPQIPKRGRKQNRVLTAETLDGLVDQAAQQIVKGESIRYAKRGPPMGELDENTREAIQKGLGVTAEEFTERVNKRIDEFDQKLAEKLGEASTVLSNKLVEYANNGKLTPSNIAFALSVAEQTRARLEGKNSIQNASVNIAITQYNGSDPNFNREKLIEALKPKTKSVINVEAVDAASDNPPHP